MKKLLIILMAITTVMIIDSCKKKGGDVNPLSDRSYLGLGSYLTLDSNLNLNLDYTQLSTSTVGIKVSEYPSGQPVDHIDLFVTEGASYDTTLWHLIKSVSYSGKGTTLSTNGTELATALGINTSDFQPGSYYTFYTRIITKNGDRFDVNSTGDNGGGGLVTGPYYNSAFSFTAYITCPFTGSAAGNYKVVRDDWADWNVGDVVTVTDGTAANEISLAQVYPNPAYGTLVNPIIVNIDPATGTASIPKVIFGHYSVDYTAEGAGANDVAGYVFSCTGFITLNINISGDPYRLILQKL